MASIDKYDGIPGSDSYTDDSKFNPNSRGLRHKEMHSDEDGPLPICAVERTPISVRIQWPKTSLPPGSSYEVKYRIVNGKVFKHAKDEDIHGNEVNLKDLTPNTTYKVIVSVQEEEGDTQKINAIIVTTKESPAEQLKALSEQQPGTGGQNGLLIYKMKVLNTPTENDDGVKRLSFVKDENETQKFRNKEKNILLVGNTGAGKSTMVDALFNHLASVYYFDNFRYKITCDTENKGNQTKSQTANTTCYTLPKESGLSTKYTLNIIDTPGFNDTDNKNVQRKIVTQVKDLLEKVTELHAICIVMPLSSFRLTETQANIIEGITGLFAKDVNDILYCLATFNDGGELHVMKTLSDGKVNVKDIFSFCNAGLFNKHENGGSDKWSANYTSFKNFLDKVYETEGQSMENTKDVLAAVKRIEIKLESLEDKVGKATQDAINVQTELTILKERKKDLKLGKNFEYTIQVPRDVKKRISNTDKALNCKKCEHTCHKNCWAKWSIFFWTCESFESFHCTVCPGKCDRKDHVKESAIYEVEYDTVIKTDEDLKSKYNAIGENKQSLITELEKVDTFIVDIKQCVLQLNEKTLRSKKFSAEDYVDTLIKMEESKRQPGFQKRVEFYELILKNIQHQDPARRALQNLLKDIDD